MEKIFYEQAYADFGYGLSMLEKNLDSDRRTKIWNCFLRTKKKEIRQYNFGSRQMAQYNKHTADPVMGRSYFMNRKK